MSIAPDEPQNTSYTAPPQNPEQNTTMGGLDPDIAKNEPVTPDNAMTPDSMTPPTEEERVRQKSYAQIRREHKTTEDEEKAEKARLELEPKISGGRLSVGMQPQPTPQHLEETVWLPKFSVDDARKLKGGEGQQFRVDAVKMVEAETARVAQLHETVGISDIGLGCDGLVTDPPNDFTSLDQALAAAQEQVELKDNGDSDVKEIAIISEALQQTARYWAIEVPEQGDGPPPEEIPEEDPPLQRADESEDSFSRRYAKWQAWKMRQPQQDQYSAAPDQQAQQQTWPAA